MKKTNLTMKTLFIIKKLGLSTNKQDKDFYYLDNPYYKKWKKTLGRFYTLNVKSINKELNNKEAEELNNLIKIITKNNLW